MKTAEEWQPEFGCTYGELCDSTIDERKAIIEQIQSDARKDLEQERDQLKREKAGLEKELAEAQQWIDSEPDWKDKYNANYLALQQENERLKEELSNGRDSVIKEISNLSDDLQWEVVKNVEVGFFDYWGTHQLRRLLLASPENLRQALSKVSR